MLSQLLTAAMIVAASPQQGEIVVINDAPSIIIPLRSYDLAREGDLRRVRSRIAHAAKLVCDTGSSGLAFVEAVQCSRWARTGAEAQLRTLLANRPTAALPAAITVSAPMN